MVVPSAHYTTAPSLGFMPLPPPPLDVTNPSPARHRQNLDACSWPNTTSTAKHPDSATMSQAQQAGKHVLVVSHRPTELVQQLALSLSSAGAHVTLALRHTQDGRCLVERLSLPGITSSATPLDTARLASVHDFAADINSSGQPLDLLIVDSWDLHAAGSKNGRWYTPQGVSGKAQVRLGWQECTVTGMLAPTHYLCICPLSSCRLASSASPCSCTSCNPRWLPMGRRCC